MIFRLSSGLVGSGVGGISIKVKEPSKFKNGDGSSPHLPISGRQQSAHDASLTVLSALIRIINCIQQPINSRTQEADCGRQRMGYTPNGFPIDGGLGATQR